MPEYEASPILVESGKRYRLIFINDSMMHHPMHIHGHWFILRNGHGEHDPLLHTIDVPPGATAVADFDADASGQWFFHCHHMYHMMAGMARVIQYKTFYNNETKSVGSETEINNDHPIGHPPSLYFSNFFEIGVDPFKNIQKASFKALFGSDFHKLQLYSEDAEIKKGKLENADLDILYWHLISQFWALKGGVNYSYPPAQKPYLQPVIGIEGIMPYFIDTDMKVYWHKNSTKLDIQLSRDTQITNNFFVRTGIRSIWATRAVKADEIGSGLNQMQYKIRPYFRLTPGSTIFAEFEHLRDTGNLRDMRREAGESAVENTLIFGVSVLF